MSDIIAYAFEVQPGKKKEYISGKDIKNFGKDKQGPTLRIKRGKMDEDDLPAMNPKSEFILDLSKDYQGITFKKKFSKGGILKVAGKLKKASKAHASQAETLEKIAEMKKGGMPARNKRNFRPTKSGAGMTRAGVKAYRRLNPGSKLKTAVTGDVKAGSKAAKRRKSYCARSLGQLKRASAKTRNDPNSRIRQARRRWKC
jgi:hypothetical protein|tara:strand:+ start:73 stop:672 length:600 start_codon:yes stop_codon:yes gene_type:complete